MKHLQMMLASHPHSMAKSDKLGQAAHHIALCAQTCTSCADACLAEPMVDHLRRCIRLNLDCADICATTSRVLTRQTDVDTALIQDLLRACATACRVCAEECEKHAGMHEHCRLCAEHCRQCVDVCEEMLEAIPAMA